MCVISSHGSGEDDREGQQGLDQVGEIVLCLCFWEVDLSADGSVDG